MHRSHRHCRRHHRQIRRRYRRRARLYRARQRRTHRPLQCPVRRQSSTIQERMPT